MGAAATKPDVDLLPPRFDRRVPSLERLSVSPLEYGFGAHARDALLGAYFAAPGTLQVQAALHPDYKEKARVSVGAQVSQEGVTSGSLGLSFTDTHSRGRTSDEPATWGISTRLNTDGDMRAGITLYDPVAHIGAYALLPLDASASSAYSHTRTHGASLGMGLHGEPLRVTHLREAVAEVKTGTMGDPSSVVSPSAAAGAPSSAAGDVPVYAHTHTRPPAEAGLRYLGDAYSAGLHASYAPSAPFKAWCVTSAPAGGTSASVSACVCVSGSARGVADVMREVGTGTQVGARTVTSDVKRGALAAALKEHLRVSGAVSLRSENPAYELSLAMDGERQEVVAGYVHSMTTRRRVYNPLAEVHVKGIYNYVDFGVELRRSVVPPFPAAIAVGAAWQANRNWLVKGRVSTRDASLSAVFKSWWDPAISVCATVGYDAVHRSPGAGFSVHIEKGGDLQYQKATLGYQAVAPSKTMIAQPQLSLRETTRVDTQPFQMPHTPLQPASSRVDRWL